MAWTTAPHFAAALPVPGLRPAVRGLPPVAVKLFPTAAVLGLGFGWAALASRSLWAAIAMHFTNNALVVVLTRAGLDEVIAGRSEGSSPFSLRCSGLLLPTCAVGLAGAAHAASGEPVRPPSAAATDDDQLSLSRCWVISLCRYMRSICARRAASLTLPRGFLGRAR